MDAQILALVSIGLTLIATITIIVIATRQSRLLTRYRALLSGPVGTDLERLLLDQAQHIAELQTSLRAVTHQAAALALDARLHIQRVGVVRFRAFPDTGSDLSFAIALLDAEDNGVVLSSLYGRSESRIYAKPLKAGTSTYVLSDEEKQAISRAQEKSEPKLRASK